MTSNFFDEKILFNSFYDVIKYSNYKVLKCYNLVFNSEKLKYNYGSYIFIFYFFCYTLFNIIFYIKGIESIKIYISKIVYNDENNNKKAKNMNKRKSQINIYQPKKSNIYAPLKKHSCKSMIDSSKINSEKSIYLNQNLKSEMAEKNILKKNRIKGRNSVKVLNNHKSSILDSCSNLHKSSKIIKKDKKVKFSQKNISIYKASNNLKSYEKKKLKGNDKDNLNRGDLFPFFRGSNFNDFELNDLDYIKAIEYDKRTFLNFYWSLIRREHLIVFTFFSCNDFNILSIKLSKFFFALGTDFALNAVFFLMKQ